MIILLDAPPSLMDHLKGWSVQQRFIALIMVLTVTSKGSACEFPSSPQCFRRTSRDSVNRCEWSMLTSTSNVTYYLHFNTTNEPFTEYESDGLDKNWTDVIDELVISTRSVYIWVTAHVGSSRCRSPSTTAILRNTVKYKTPQNISMSRVSEHLDLTWTAAEDTPALVEVLFHRAEDTTESNSSIKAKALEKDKRFIYSVSVMNLQRDSPYQVRVRQKSTQALNSLWSDWSQVQTVPAEIENGPEVILATTEAFENGTRLLKLTWKAVPQGAAVSGVTYVLEDSQSYEDCPCRKMKKKKIRDQTEYSIYVTNFYVNINITAINTVGTSPPTLFHEPAKPAKDLKACDRHGSVPKVKQPRTCLQWYEYRSGSTRPDTVNTVKGKDRYQQMATKMKDFVRYYYFEHKCVGGTPQTIETCLFYKKEGAPRKPPVLNIGTTQTSADLSWKEIPVEDQQGFLTHYTVCSVRTSSSRQAHTKECYNVSASHTRYRLENLTPGSRYNISLAGATKAGVGPIAVVYINTASKKPVTGGRFSEALQFSSSPFVWLSLGLVMVFFLTSIMCTSVCKRMKNRIFPPIPKPVIPDSAYRPDNQEILEMKEEVQELSLHQLQDNRIQESEDLEETTFLGEVCETDGDREEALEDGTIVGGSRTPEGSDEPLSPSYKSQFLRCSGDLEITDLGQEDNEITTLMYRNGLVFDMKADSTEDVGIPQLGRGN